VKRLVEIVSSAVLLGALSACASGPPPLPAGQAIGEQIAAREPLPLESVLAKPDAHLEQTLLVDAKVVNVCRAKGCWMQVEPGAGAGGAGSSPIMVRWESGCGGKYAFPYDSIGRRVLIQGSFYPKEISEADAQHLESESGGQAIPRRTYEMNASGVIVFD
jgi:hypothetical protein